jgi:hypothetical protein
VDDVAAGGGCGEVELDGVGEGWSTDVAVGDVAVVVAEDAVERDDDVDEWWMGCAVRRRWG